MTAERAFATEVGRRTIGVVVVFCAILALFEWVDGAGLGRLPALVMAVLPVAAGVAGAGTTAAWADGRWVAVLAAGISPVRMGLAAAVAVGLVAGGLAAVREVTTPPVDRRDAAVLVDGGWFTAEDHGVRGALIADGRVVGRVVAEWGAAEARGVRWAPAGAEPAVADLPSPDAWPTRPTWLSPVAALWAGPPSAPRRAWLLERIATPVLAASAAAIGAIVGSRRGAVVLSAIVAAAVQLALLGGLAMLAR